MRLELRSLAAEGRLPGLLLTGLLAGAALLLAQLPGLSLAGPLGLALLLGVGWRLTLGLPAVTVPGVRFSAATLLRLGIVLLGVRLDFGLLYTSGARMLLLVLLVITAGLIGIVALGRLFRLPGRLTWLLAVGSSICGASAIAAAAPLVRAEDSEVSQAVGIISVLGALGVLAYTLLEPVLQLGPLLFGMLTGSTLQEVGHVLATGAVGGGAALDVASVTKLTRVAMLAPVLVAVNLLMRREADALVARPPLVPWFLIGFLAVGIATSLGLIPEALRSLLQTGSLLLTALAMAAIGLRIEPAAFRQSGGRAVGVAALGFLLLVGVAALFLFVFR